MTRSFPDAEVAGHGALIHSMTCDPKDRHVLAAAVRSDAAAIVTFNMKDFPPDSTDPFEIDVNHPADFLLDLLDLAPTIVISVLEQQATADRRHPRTLNTLLDALTKAGVAGFADEVRRRTG